MPDAVYLNKSRARHAIELAEPTILKMMQTVTNHKALHIVIVGVDGQILHEQSVGPDVGREPDPQRMAGCVEIARSKAQIHFRTGRPSAEIQARRPGSLLVGDTVYGGSAEHEGIIVAVSGVQGFYDESIAGTVASILWGLCMEAQTAHMARKDKGTHYGEAL
jgi:hypothetical protein